MSDAKKLERALVLLKATRDILQQAEDSAVVEDVMELTAEYDGTDCDGGCLKDDIDHFLEYEVPS